jgi:glycosyltransferase involved in cell wall biosynthesis
VVDDGQTGLLVEPRDAHQLAAAILRLIQNEPLRTRMADAGYERVRERFTVDRMVAATAAVYARLAAAPHVADAPSG